MIGSSPICRAMRNTADAGPKRRAEQIGVFADGVGQSAIAIVELRSEFSRALEDQQG